MYWGGCALFINNIQEKKSTRIWNNLEEGLDNALYNSSLKRFFKPEFDKFFNDLKGRPCNSNFLRQVIGKYQEQWGKNVVKIYLFDGQNNPIVPQDTPKGISKLYSILNINEEKELEISNATFFQIGQEVPFPKSIIKKGRWDNNTFLIF